MLPTCSTRTRTLVLACLLIFHVHLSTPLFRFIFHQDLQMTGCVSKSYTGIIHLACAIKCLDTKKCPSFVYIPEKAYCKICADGNTETGLTFMRGTGTYLLRNLQGFNIVLPGNNNVLQLNLFGALLPSELLYVRAVLFGKEDWRINLLQNDTFIPFNFKRRVDGTCTRSPCQIINTMNNTKFVSEVQLPDFPYVKGQSFELHILLRVNYAYIYFNRRLRHTYNNTGGPVMERGRYLTLLGDFFVEELAI